MQTAQQVQNIRHAITVMERVQAYEKETGKQWLMMCSWQTVNHMGIDTSFMDRAPAKTEKEARACGYQACFGGHIAMAKEFQLQGVYPDEKTGFPRLGDVRFQTCDMVFSELFGWSQETSDSITLHSKKLFMPEEKTSGKVTPAHIIGWLEERLTEAIASQPKTNLFLTAEELVATEANEAIEKAKGSPINHQLPEVGVVNRGLV